MSSDLGAALCLVLVIEGLFLFAAPGGWKRLAEQMQGLPEQTLRAYGGILVIVGLIALQLAR